MLLKKMKPFLSALFIFCTIGSAIATADELSLPDRRKPQFETNPGYAIFPFPYSLAGIGSGISLVAGMTNIKDTYIDAYGIILGGGVKGAAAGIDDLHILPRRLILQLGASEINKASITNYGVRGMDSSKDDFNLLEISGTRSVGGRLTATFYDRRFEMYLAYYKFWSRLDRIRDSKGDVILEVNNPKTEAHDQKIAGIRFDFTDDYKDPRKGIRFDISGWYNPPQDGGAEYILLDVNSTAYLPVGSRNTWVFNYFHSDAHLIHRGETSRQKIVDKLGLNCDSIASTSDRELCNQLIDNTLAANTYGTASSLGGFSRLRAYPQGRYRGAHSRLLGTEFRWNLTDEFTPFNLYVIRDVRTAFQLAFFYEIGTIADKSSDVWSIYRQSYGTGLRIVTASGAVFRGDFAFGDEGFQPNVFIGYPWEI